MDHLPLRRQAYLLYLRFLYAAFAVTQTLGDDARGCTLDMGVVEADQWLAQHRVSLNYSFDDFKADERTLQELRSRSTR